MVTVTKIGYSLAQSWGEKLIVEQYYVTHGGKTAIEDSGLLGMQIISVRLIRLSLVKINLAKKVSKRVWNDQKTAVEMIEGLVKNCMKKGEDKLDGGIRTRILSNWKWW